MQKFKSVSILVLVLLFGASLPAICGQGVININTASAEQLMMLPGIGEKTANAIIAYRQAHGNFKTVDELARVKGIGMKKVNSLRPNLSVQGPNTYIPDQRQSKPQPADKNKP